MMTRVRRIVPAAPVMSPAMNAPATVTSVQVTGVRPGPG